MEGTPTMHSTTHSSTYSPSPQAPVQQAAPKSDRFWKITTVVLIVVLAFFAFRGSFSGNGNDSAGTGAAVANLPSAGAGLPPAPQVDMDALVDDNPVKGDPDAPVTIIEFSDFECPFCGRFYSQTLGQIEEQYVKTGKVRFIYRDFPLSFHPNAQKAAEAAECAGEQGKYWEMHDLLFEQGVQGGVASFKQYAQQIGLDTAKFGQCLDSGAMASEVRKDFADGSAAGVSGTPAFFINGQLVSGAQPFQVFQQVIEGALAS